MRHRGTHIANQADRVASLAPDGISELCAFCDERSIAHMVLRKHDLLVLFDGGVCSHHELQVMALFAPGLATPERFQDVDRISL